MQIRFVQSWRRFTHGDIADFGDPVNDVLVRRRLAEWMPEPQREKAVRKRGNNAALHLESAR